MSSCSTRSVLLRVAPDYGAPRVVTNASQDIGLLGPDNAMVLQAKAEVIQQSQNGRVKGVRCQFASMVPIMLERLSVVLYWIKPVLWSSHHTPRPREGAALGLR